MIKYVIHFLIIFILGFITWMLPLSKFTKFMMCSIFNILWNTVFMEIWKRKISELCFKWGTFDAELTDEPRPQFRGILKFSLIFLKLILSLIH